MTKQQIKYKVVNSIIENSTIELDNTGQERYSLNEKQFGELVEALTKQMIKQPFTIH